jgi:hypothetical protein
MDADETHADCGGADCAPCSTCISTKLPGTGGYCSPSCLCGAGGTDCSAHTDCLPGLLCAIERGYKYGYAFGTDTCIPQHCLDRVKDADEVGPDWGGSCGNVQCGSPDNGGYQHCTVSCPCVKGHGDCDSADECSSGLVCGSGTTWGLAYNICQAAHCTNSIKDADETAKNCGGADCAPCP